MKINMKPIYDFTNQGVEDDVEDDVYNDHCLSQTMFNRLLCTVMLANEMILSSFAQI